MPRPGVEQIMVRTYYQYIRSSYLVFDQWHDVLYLLRHMIFLVLPFVTLYFLPLAPETTPALVHTVTVLQDTLRRLEMFAGVQAASMRSPSLRQRIVGRHPTELQLQVLRLIVSYRLLGNAGGEK